MPLDRDDYDDEDDIDADPDERYRRRHRRYGSEYTDEDEDEEERDEAESEQVARRKCLWPGLLMIVAGLLGLVGALGFVAVIATGIGAAPPAPGAPAATTTILSVCAGIPLVFGLLFCGLQLAGGICMLRRRVRGLVITGGILGGLAVVAALYSASVAGFPPACWLMIPPTVLGIPAAIWMFVVLQDHDVQASFERSKYYG